MARYNPTSPEFRAKGENTPSRHGFHKVGDTISFKTPDGRLSGKILSIGKESYSVNAGGILHKVNHNSMLYSLGVFAGRIAESAKTAKDAYDFGKEKERENLQKYKSEYGKKKRVVAKRKPKKK
jgi:hypothetical protein